MGRKDKIGQLTREQSPQTASVTSVFILILSNFMFKIITFHLFHWQQRPLQTLKIRQKQLPLKACFIKGESGRCSSTSWTLSVHMSFDHHLSLRIAARRECLHYSNAFCVSVICQAEGLSSAIKRWVVLSYASRPLLN